MGSSTVLLAEDVGSIFTGAAVDYFHVRPLKILHEIDSSSLEIKRIQGGTNVKYCIAIYSIYYMN